MKPLDRRLLRYARRAVAPIAALGALGLTSAVLVIAQAWLLATMIAQVFIDKATLAACTAPLTALAGVTVARAVIAWATQAAAHRACAEAKAELRGALLTRVLALGPRQHQPRRDAAALTQLATTGLDGLDGYFTSYLPALIGAVAIPLAVLITITVADPVSGLVVTCTLPLVPLSGALIGRATGPQAARRWRALATLAHHFHDVVSGLPTLRVFGRAQDQRSQIARVTSEYRRATLGALRLAFLSGLALELIAAMSVALVATEIGLRLAYGQLDLRAGLLVLICAPEAYLPLRALGTQFHATADGLAAAEEIFAILETEPPGPAPVPATGTPAADPVLAFTHGPAGRSPVAGGPADRSPVAGGPAGDRSPVAGGPAGHRRIDVNAVTVRHPGRAAPAPDRATFTIEPGRLTVLTGPSGCGKTTLLSCLLGFTVPASGTIASGPVASGPVASSPVASSPITSRPVTAGSATSVPLRSEAFIRNGPVAPAQPPASTPPARDQFGWLPQDPTLFTGTVAENIRLGWPAAPDEAVAAAASAAALDDVPLTRPLGDHGTGLSTGQRRRVALARALLPGRPVLLLDEPTAGLDAAREALVIETLRGYAALGHAVLAVSHRPAVIAAADTVVDLGQPAHPTPPATTGHANRPATPSPRIARPATPTTPVTLALKVRPVRGGHTFSAKSPNEITARSAGGARVGRGVEWADRAGRGPGEGCPGWFWRPSWERSRPPARWGCWRRRRGWSRGRRSGRRCFT